MLKAITLVLVLPAIVAFPVFSQATEVHGKDCTSCHTLSNKEASELLRRTGGTVKSIKQSHVKGMFELLMEKDGRQGVIYIDYSKKYLVQGLVINLETLQTVSSHKFPQQKQIAGINTNSIPVHNALVMGNPKSTRKLYVFTDPDCPYCRKLHLELKKLAKIDPDVAIYILLYPLPMHLGAYDKARAIVEAHDLVNLDEAFDGKEVPKPQQESSKAAIGEITNFANINGISVTPTMVLPNGKVEVGMRNAEKMKKLLLDN